MMGGLASFVRAFESIPADASPADRFHATLEASDAFMAECDRIQMQHRLDMIARWGLDETHFISGPPRDFPTLEGN